MLYAREVEADAAPPAEDPEAADAEGRLWTPGQQTGGEGGLWTPPESR